jgi:hypothetical protein
MKIYCPKGKWIDELLKKGHGCNVKKGDFYEEG